MNELQSYALSGVALFVPIMSLFWLDIWRARADAQFRAAFPGRGRLSPLFFVLTLAEALLAAMFPPDLGLPLRIAVGLAVVAASGAVGALLMLGIRLLPKTEGRT
jgi:hypothetical protein